MSIQLCRTSTQHYKHRAHSLAELDKIPKDKPLLVHCLSGGRSAYATGILQSHGFDATQLDGGYEAWQKAGGEMVVG